MTEKIGSYAAPIAAGRKFIDVGVSLRLTKYKRLVLPTDDYSIFVQLPVQKDVADASVHGHLHIRQDKTEDVLDGEIVVSVKDSIALVDEIEPDESIVAEWSMGEGKQTYRFVFAHVNRYRQADMYHYTAHLLTPQHAWPYVPIGGKIPESRILSNAYAPLKYAMSQAYDPDKNGIPYLKELCLWTRGGEVTFFPAYMAALNQKTPYISIICNRSNSQEAYPDLRYGGFENVTQEEVTFSCVGMTNREILSFQSYLLSFPNYFPEVYGIGSSARIQDSGYPIQGSLTNANVKELRFLVNYTQETAWDYTLVLIKQAGITLNPEGEMIWAPSMPDNNTSQDESASQSSEDKKKNTEE